jgi:hypothetical protein
MFKKQDKPKFFGGLLGSMTRALAPLTGTALGGYLGSLSTNPYAIVAGGSAGNYLGNEGGKRLADVIEQYMPFARGGQVPSRKAGGVNPIVAPDEGFAGQKRDRRRQLKNMGYTDKQIDEMIYM